MKIIVAPHPVLRQKCQPIEPAELPKLAKTAHQMARLMYKSAGCGLAAPQIGINKRLVVVDTTVPEEDKEFVPDPLFLVNPVITFQSDTTESSDEGCLSIPGITVEIERPVSIVLEAWDLEGNTIEVKAEGFTARALQHELDHLDGITMFEHLDSIARIEKLQEFEQAKASGARPGDTSIADVGTGGQAQSQK
ncbi:MAG: peptide deformylase [Coriobacteriales bacterium]|jgi:peptide deformylase|nr:peptide deformylase [Coriobacteriales bacterium]